MVRSVTYIPTLEYVGIMYLVLSILLYVELALPVFLALCM